MTKPRVRIIERDDVGVLVSQMPRSIEEAFVTRGVAIALAYALDHAHVVFGKTFNSLCAQTECQTAMAHFMAPNLVPEGWVSQLGRRSTSHTDCTVCTQIEHLGRMAHERVPELYRRAGTKGMWTSGNASHSADTSHPVACDHASDSSAEILAISCIHGPLPVIWRAEPTLDDSNMEVLP